MKRKLISHGIVAALSLAFGFWLGNKNKPTTVEGPAVITTPGNTIVISQPGKPGKPVYQPDPGSTVISTDPHGNVTVKVKQVGVGFAPGIGLAFADKARLTLDGRVAFYKRLGLNVGLAFSLEGERTLGDVVKPFAALSYALPFKLTSNTSVFVGSTLDRLIIGGAKVRF